MILTRFLSLEREISSCGGIISFCVCVFLCFCVCVCVCVCVSSLYIEIEQSKVCRVVEGSLLYRSQCGLDSKIFFYSLVKGIWNKGDLFTSIVSLNRSVHFF